MLVLRPSPRVVVLYLLAFIMAVTGFLVSALSWWQVLLAGFIALSLALIGVRRYWVDNQGVLFFGEHGCAWQPQGAAAEPVILKHAVGWSDWILQVTIGSCNNARPRRHQLIILSDNCDADQRRRLRAFVLAQALEDVR